MRFRVLNLLVIAIVVLVAVANFLFFDFYVQKQIDKVLINAIRQNLYHLTLHVNEHLNDPSVENIHILLDRTKACSPEIAELYIVDDKGKALVTTDYHHARTKSVPKNARSVDRLDSHNITDTGAVFTEVYRLEELKKIPYRIYAKLDRRYIVGMLASLQHIQMLFPLIYFLLFMVGYFLFYRLVVKPILGLEGYIEGRRDTLPRTFVREIDTLSKNVQHYIRALKEMAYIDPLTQVHNRRSIDNALDLAIESAKRDNSSFCIAIVDLDHFKEINDTYGHNAGDQLLREMVERIKGHLRQVDQIGRIGGDEFLIIFHHDEHPENILQALERIVALAQKPFTLAKAEVVCTLSIGVATCKRGGEEKAALFKRADKAMYVVKGEGGNRVRLD